MESFQLLILYLKQNNNKEIPTWNLQHAFRTWRCKI